MTFEMALTGPLRNNGSIEYSIAMTVLFLLALCAIPAGIAFMDFRESRTRRALVEHEGKPEERTTGTPTRRAA